MRIKSLEVVGFKSFAQRAKLAFGRGITGVVGPNGCGKSNVVDAIRWVMGEMSAKHLRGRGMQDVIFAGAEGRGAQSMAEVTLTFDNDGDVPSAYLSASEIAVTRRLFRDGTSEYLINKSAVRLRDVTDLFLGTGVGTRAYSIIEQGRIGFVVNARPEERRSLIEEVAGITKFKVRKKSAERRMEATEQNLARVRDVLGELDRQLTTLREQAERARQYRRRKEALYDLELHRATYDWLRLRLFIEHERGRQQRLAERVDQGDSTLADEEAAHDRAEHDLRVAEEALGTQQDEVTASTKALAAEQRDVMAWTSRAEQLREQGARAAAEAAALAERLAAAEAEGARLAAAHASATQDATAAAAGLGELAERARAAEAAVAERDAELQRLRDDALRQVRAAADSQSRIASLTAQVAGIEEQIARSQPEQQEARAELAQVQEQLAGERQELARQDALAAELDGEIEFAGQQWAEAKGGREQAMAALRAQEAHGARIRHRLQSLQEVVQRLDGYADGVRWLLGKDKKGRPHFAHREDIDGVVAEVLDVPGDYERAIEAALGERLQYLRVPGGATAKGAIAALQAGKAGQSGFVAGTPPTADGRALPAAASRAGNGVLGSAARLVTARDGQEALVEALLGDVVLVDTLATAEREAAAHAGTRATWVTVDGECVDGFGLWRGGTKSGAGLLANRREIREKTAEAERAANDEAAAREALAEAEAAVAAGQQRHAGAKERRQATELQRVSCRRDLGASEGQVRRLGERLASLQRAHEGLQARRVEGVQARDEAVACARDAEGQGDEARERIERAESARQADGEAYRGLAAQLTEQRVREASQRERADALATAKRRLEGDVESMAAQRARAESAAKDSTQEAEGLAAQARAAEGSLAERQEAAARAEQDLLEARAALAERREARAEGEQRLRALRRDAGSAQAELGERRLALQKLEQEQEALSAQVRERHDVWLEEVLPEFHDRPAPTAAHKREQARLWREIKDMGSIHLTAIEECERVDARATFLRAQQEDLEHALSTLRQAVLRINKDSRERFKEAFEAVNGMFEKVYPRLFGGGSARLTLTEADDLLDAGVDIVAMPPGKKLQNVTLLSGGEKALTATALVFSIFLIKPSPFCVLDEVDAPLDEANVGRFNEMLREIAKISQFIVITHNKQTMVQMDRLFGVTMEQAGMSKVVAVDLEQRAASHAA